MGKGRGVGPKFFRGGLQRARTSYLTKILSPTSRFAYRLGEGVKFSDGGGMNPPGDLLKKLGPHCGPTTLPLPQRYNCKALLKNNTKRYCIIH